MGNFSEQLWGDSPERRQPDPGEFREARWWARAEIGHADPALFDPHMNRMLAKFDHARTASNGT